MIRCLLVAALGFAFTAIAQDRPPIPLYRLNVEIVEQSDPQTSAPQTMRRNYEMLVEANTLGKINASLRVPYVSGRPDEPQVHTVALGSIIECTPREAERGVRVDCAIESSSVFAPQHRSEMAAGLPPQMQSRQIRAAATIPLEQRVLLSAFDDPVTQHHLDVFLTARRVAQ